ncbi:MAG: hypothetical protein JNL42_09350, partial [Anaerolineae bacterium]|nr:hypothetical protein [Anaerolineae bacterium]
NEEAARVVQLARERGDLLVDREALVQAAQSRAANIIEAARQESEVITGDADGYVLDSLGGLEQQLVKLLTIVRNGISEVNKKPTPSGSRGTTPAATMPVQQPQLVEVSAQKPANE